MVKEEVKRIISDNGKFNDVIKLMCVEKVDSKIKETNMKEYGLEHDILEKSVRPDRQVKKNGIVVREEKVARIVLPYQKKIVEYAIAFLFGKPINLETTDSDKTTFENFSDIWRKKLKMDNVLKDVARKTMIEQEAAILFYPDLKSVPIMDENGNIQLNENSEPVTKVTERKLRSRVLCLENGDEIFPYFDEYDDMEAFTRKYTTMDIVTKKKVTCYDIYFDDIIIFGRKIDKEWQVATKPNIMGKIPVVYFYQKEKEWNDSQVLIDREEMHSSKHADTNDYFGSPAVVAEGKVKNAPEKGDVAKFFEMEPIEGPDGKITYGKISYLTYDKDIDSVKQEHDLNNERIHSFTSTPNITLDTLKSLGNTSGVALEIMFYDPMLKAQNKQELYGPMIERCINLLKVMIGTFLDLGSKEAYEKLNVEFQFSNPLPNNITELVDVLSVAVGGKAIMAQEDAVNKNPLVTDKTQAITNLQKQIQQEQEQDSKIEKSFN